MNQQELTELLEQVKSGEISIDAASEQIKQLPFEDLGYAKVDHHRALRVGYPEVIYCENKALEHIEGIVRSMLERGSNVLATRASREVYEAILKVAPDAEYHELARIVTVKRSEIPMVPGTILIATAGTADIAVAEEAAVTAEMLGNPVTRVYDVGVAGLHRLLARMDVIRSANVVICVAGMEGALASVVGGLIDKPLIAVPTSVGYGASFHGLSALLTMLNSCASGVGVVNIDNGFGAAYLASNINRINLHTEEKQS